MSNSVLTLFPGLAFSITKKPIWNTNVSGAVSGREYAVKRRLYPLWEFKLPYEVLRARLSELQTIVGFFNARGGRYDDWLYLDPRENTLTAQLIGTGDGTTKAFEVVKAWGSFVEPVGAVNAGTLQVFVNAVSTVAYTLDAQQRIITFTTAPPAGQAVTVTGQFYYRVRFLNDSLSLEEFMVDKWKTDLQFRSFRAP